MRGDKDLFDREDFAHWQGACCTVVRAPQAARNAASGQKIAAFGGGKQPRGVRSGACPMLGIALRTAPSPGAVFPPSNGFLLPLGGIDVPGVLIL